MAETQELCSFGMLSTVGSILNALSAGNILEPLLSPPPSMKTQMEGSALTDFICLVQGKLFDVFLTHFFFFT